ncbi:MAG: hypothetical protein RL757_664 [Bacteroidota bacterium]|jgi:hypothetical protein
MFLQVKYFKNAFDANLTETKALNAVKTIKKGKYTGGGAFLRRLSAKIKIKKNI